MTCHTTIQSLGQRGEGIADIKGAKVYVPFTLPGERVEIERQDDRGTLLELLEASPERIDPFCPYFTRCGGCQLQHVGPQAYASFKHGLVETALSHAGIQTPVDPLRDARGKGRRRATLHARNGQVGYMQARSHRLLDIDQCPILVPSLVKTAPRVARIIAATVGDCDIAITATLTGLDVDIRTDKPVKPQKLVPMAQQLNLARLTLKGDMVLQTVAPVLAMGRSKVELPPGSFLQATEAAEQVLADLVMAGLDKSKAVADLFCGLGPFTLRMAERARVHAVDSDKPAILALEKAVRFTQGIKQVSAHRRDLFREPLTAFELETFDAVVFDPPRAGAEAQASLLAASSVKTVVAVSCEPKTFARDAAILMAGGYALRSVTPVDQFAWSTHVEVVGVFSR